MTTTTQQDWTQGHWGKFAPQFGGGPKFITPDFFDAVEVDGDLRTLTKLDGSERFVLDIQEGAYLGNDLVAWDVQVKTPEGKWTVASYGDVDAGEVSSQRLSEILADLIRMRGWTEEEILED